MTWKSSRKVAAVVRPLAVAPMLPGIVVVGATVKVELSWLMTIGDSFLEIDPLELKTKSRSTPTSSRKFRWIVRKRVSTVTRMLLVSRS